VPPAPPTGEWFREEGRDGMSVELSLTADVLYD
jgi:hypothetical protein